MTIENHIGALTRLPDVPRFEHPALCAETDPEQFFPPVGVPSRDAKAICRRCDAREECLEFALAYPENMHGVWGGLSENERRALRRQRERQARQRPISHGTTGGYKTHQRRGEVPCPSCTAAQLRANQERAERDAS